jgi:hypothetical protein
LENKKKNITSELLVTGLKMYRGDDFLIMEAICWVIYIWKIIYLSSCLAQNYPFDISLQLLMQRVKLISKRPPEILA